MRGRLGWTVARSLRLRAARCKRLAAMRGRLDEFERRLDAVVEIGARLRELEPSRLH